MNAPELGAPVDVPGRSQRSLRSFLLTTLVFVVLGSMLSGLAFVVAGASLGAHVLGAGEGWGALVIAAFTMPWIWIPQTFVPALFVGLAVGWIDQFVKPTSLGVAAAIGCFVGIAWGMLITGAASDIDGVIVGLVAIGAAVASGLCWLVTLPLRRWRR